MEIYILSEKFAKIGIIDYAESVIWTRRYYTAGDFEIYVAADDVTKGLLRCGNYVLRDKSLMEITSVQLTTSLEDGDYITASGKCMKYLLHRRIIWKQTNLKGDVTAGIVKLINENAISPDISSRSMENIEVTTPDFVSGDISVQITGDNLYDKICELCEAYKMGWDAGWDGEAVDITFYQGKDRTSEAIYSDEYDTLLSFTGNVSMERYANTALVAGEGEGTARKTQTVGAYSGWNRYELYVDARDLSQNKDSSDKSEIIDDETYAELLVQRGKEKLEENAAVNSVEGELSEEVYNLNLGDVVLVKNVYGYYTARVTEIIECEDENGYTRVPTFKNESEDETDE